MARPHRHCCVLVHAEGGRAHRAAAGARHGIGISEGHSQPVDVEDRLRRPRGPRHASDRLRPPPHAAVPSVRGGSSNAPPGHPEDSSSATPRSSPSRSRAGSLPQRKRRTVRPRPPHLVLTTQGHSSMPLGAGVHARARVPLGKMFVIARSGASAVNGYVRDAGMLSAASASIETAAGWLVPDLKHSTSLGWPRSRLRRWPRSRSMAGSCLEQLVLPRAAVRARRYRLETQLPRGGLRRHVRRLRRRSHL